MNTSSKPCQANLAEQYDDTSLKSGGMFSEQKKIMKYIRQALAKPIIR